MSEGVREVPGAAKPRIQCTERRASVRYVTTMTASYHPIDVHTLGPSSPARIWDLSLGGLSLVVNHAFEPGTVVGVVPECLPLSLFPCLAARVQHLRPHGDGLWLAGCEFLTPLTEEQLAALMG